MQRTAIYKRFTFIIIFLLYGLVSLATGGDSSGRTGAPLPFNEVFKGYVPKLANTGNTVKATSRSFAQLDEYIAGEQFSFQATGTEFTDQYFEEVNTANTTAEEYKAKARAVLAEIENSNSYIDYLEPSDINKLPIGLRKRVGNTEITIAISNATFTDKYANLTVYARVKIPQAPYELLFGISGLKLSYKGGIIGNASLVLLGDVAIPINGDNAALILKGSMDMATGESTSKTFITVSCNGFEQLGVNGEIQFSRNMIVPSDAAGTIYNGRVTAALDQILVTNWNDMIIDLTFQSPFQVNGLQGFNFTVTRAVFDFSDLHNSEHVVYPQGYQQKYLNADNLTAWRGVYVEKLSIGLPKAIKNRDNPNAIVSFGVDDLLIDNNGISGVFFGENVLPINKGTASGWQFSIDSIRVAFEANNLIRAGFGGKVGLPVNQSDDGNNKRKFLGYSAVISANSEYVLRVTTLDEMDFDVWKAKVFLLPNSWVQISGNSTTFKPEAMLHGKMGIIALATDENPGRDASKAPVADFQGITFRSLHLTVDNPYIDAEYLGYEGEVRLGNFPVSIYNIAMVKDPSTNRVGIGLGLKVNLHENEFSGNASFKIWGKLNTEREITSWKYSKLEIGEIAISAKVKDVIKLDGSVKFLDDHPVYGDGFAGHIKCVVEKGLGPDPITVEVNATFGKTTFRYWYVDGLADLGTGIGGAVKIQGFGGGAYYRMKKEGFSTSFSATGAKYVPDENSGLGIKAAVIFSVGSKKIVKGEASFEVAFNKGGGLRYIGLFGYAKFMGEIPGLDNMADFAKKKFEAVETKLNSLNIEALNNMKIMQPSNAAKEAYPTTERPGQNGLAAYIGIQYDFEARSLHATFDMYVNAAKGLITGAASENRAGWAVFHVDPKEWYLHVGTPTDRLGMKIGIGKFNLKTGSYLMAGYNMPKFPDPPYGVVNALRQAGIEYENNINKGDVEGGRGIAFGTSLELATGDVRFLFFYANFAAGLGFDVMIKDWGNAHCEGSSEQIGINGWYAQGQAYAYLQGELGVKIKILFVKKNISIIKGSAAALLQAKLPNPTWVGGYMGFSVNILGGAIKGRFNFKFSFGNDCKIVEDENISEYDDLEFISNITPDDQASNVSVLTAPQVKFTIKPGATLDAPREDGSGNDVFMPVMETFKLYEGSTEVAGSTSFNTGGDVLTFKPDAVLKSKTSYKAVARISIRQLINGYWVPITENGQTVEQIKEATFTTGDAPDSIPYSLLDKLYPFFNQRNLYKGENNKGVISLKQDFHEFFEKFGRWKIRVEDLSGNMVSTVDATHNGSTIYNFTVPTNLQPNTTYRMKLMGEQPLKPTSDVNKPGLVLTFTTSRFNTLAAKIQSLHVNQTIVEKVSSDVINLQAAVDQYEGFELYEITGTQYTGNKGMIEGEADLTDDVYYQNIIKPLMYSNIPLTGDNKTFRLEGTEALLYGTPPTKALTPAWFYINMLQSKEYNEVLNKRMPFVHNTNKYINLQFLEYRKKIIATYLGASYGFWVDRTKYTTIAEPFRKLCNEGFPFMLKGKYKVRFTLVQLDGTRGTTSEFVYENPIE